MDEIKITLETLYDILRHEKKKEDLQKLEDTFYIDVVSYVREKNALLDSKKQGDELFAASEKDKLEYELRSIRRILKELYEKREKKIIDICLNRSRTGSDIIDTSAMLREEKQFYDALLERLDAQRRGVLMNLFKAKLPDVSARRVDMSVSKPSREVVPGEIVEIKILHPIPGFVWKDLKKYGPYDTGEVIEIFSEIAALLVRKERAEYI